MIIFKVLRTGQGTECSKCCMFVKSMRKYRHTAIYCHTCHYYHHAIPTSLSIPSRKLKMNAKDEWP